MVLAVLGVCVLLPSAWVLGAGATATVGGLTVTSADTEILAIRAIATALLSIDAKARRRVLRFAVDWTEAQERRELSMDVGMPPFAEKEPA